MGNLRESAGRCFPPINRDTQEASFFFGFIVSRCVDLNYDGHLVIIEDGSI